MKNILEPLQDFFRAMKLQVFGRKIFPFFLFRKENQFFFKIKNRLDFHSKRVKVFFFCMFFLFPFSGEAKLADDFRENFPEIIKDLCNSVIEYSIDDPVGINYEEGEGMTCSTGKCQEYHTLLSCAFGSAFSQAVSDTNNTAIKNTDEISLKKILGRHSISFDTQKCKGKSLGELQNKQKAKGFTSRCTETPHLNAVYSPCKVAETVLLEYCGYQKFLVSKTLDRISYKKENPQYQGIDVPDGVKKLYMAELEKSESTLNQMLEYYRNFQQKYWFDVWLNSMLEEINPLQKKLIKIWKNVAQFPDKFVGPSRDY